MGYHSQTLPNAKKKNCRDGFEVKETQPSIGAKYHLFRGKKDGGEGSTRIVKEEGWGIMSMK